MFDNPKKELRRLQEELLAEEEEQWLEEEEDLDLEDLDGLLEEPGYEEYFEEDDAAEAAEPLYRNHANGYGAGVRNYANRYGRGSPKKFDDDVDYDDGDLEDEEVLYREDYRRAKRKKRRKNLALLILAVLEIIAIGAIAVWWASWLL